jgi:hypothetical protein
MITDALELYEKLLQLASTDRNGHLSGEDDDRTRQPALSYTSSNGNRGLEVLAKKTTSAFFIPFPLQAETISSARLIDSINLAMPSNFASCVIFIKHCFNSAVAKAGARDCRQRDTAGPDDVAQMICRRSTLLVRRIDD